MIDKIKNYPIQLMDSKLREIENVAGKRKIKEFILTAIEEKLQISKDIKLIIGRDATSEDYKKLGEILKRNLVEEKLEREKR